MKTLERKINHLPVRSGVYLFKDSKGTILYVGKAGNIRHRVSSYFQKPGGKDLKTLTMIGKISDMDTIVTDTEKEAFILENHLIKTHHPRYNIRLKDDKNYPCLRISMEDPFPTLSIVRRIQKDRSVYYGPFPSATSLRETLKLIRRIFPVRVCLDAKFMNRSRPCINYEMGRCLGPCCDKTDPVLYREMIHQIRMFLEGKNKDLLEHLNKRMKEESEKLHFEKAGKIRDQIEHIQNVVEKQKIVSTDFLDQDVVGFYRQDHTAAVYILFIRAGKLLGGKGFHFSSMELPNEEVLSSFLRQYYREGRFIPEEILLTRTIPDHTVTEHWLTELKAKRVHLLIPARGEKKRLLQMANENARSFLVAGEGRKEEDEKLLTVLKEKLFLKNIPRKIEAFDISNIQGRNAVGSMVYFENGRPDQKRYRHYRIKTVEGADDYGMMYEVLLRRYQKGVQENDLPDLVLLDGGRGQLNVAQEVFKELKLKGVDLVGLAKERTIQGPDASGSGMRKTEEKIFHPQYKTPILLGKASPLLHFLDRIRDEAHRFAVTYHKKVRTRETIQSELGRIPGVGKARQKELLKYFGSLDKIRETSVAALIRTPRIDRKTAEAVYRYFRS